MAKNQGVPPWVWIGCGCGLCLLLLVGGIVGMGALGVGFFKGMVEDLADPEARRANVLSTLGAEDLPEGYEARISFSIPFLFELAIVDDGDPAAAVEGESFEAKAQSVEDLIIRPDRFERFAFVYLEQRGRREGQTIEEILSGSRTTGGTQVDLGLEFESVEPLDRGELEVHGQAVEWRSARGDLGTIGGTMPAAWAAVRYSCDDEKARDGLWIEKLDAPDAVPTRVNDPAELKRFLDHFRVCG